SEAGLTEMGETLGGDGDGDGDNTEAEGQEAETEGDGDGDPTGDGDGDGDPSGDGDGDGDPSGDGDGDGDGDGETTATTGNPGNCQAPAEYIDCDGTPGALTTNPFQAIGVNCGDDPTTTVVAANATMNSNNNNAWRIATQFGTANQNMGDNRYNGKLWAANLTNWINPNDEEIPNNTSTAILILSTGVVAAANGQGVVTETNGNQDANGENNNLDDGGLPVPLSALRGSNNGQGGTPFENCDGVNDCSDSLYNHWYVNGWNNPNDKLWMTMDLTVPAGTEGYVFDFAYFSSEFPSWYNTQYNDLFIAWSTSETYTGNITFVNQAPLTITSLENAGAFQYKANAPQLAGTGFEGHAGTGWFAARGSAAPEENFQVTFFIADMADSSLATGVLLDNFRWECAGCIPSEVDSCGIQPQ
ncbi:MAG TPA: choice-of-anchor L domain-containing protein, partial [Enhygromyxa sp.]|nr:choice-of-anchor L domain-containing protein [Enhygromyxa sp.]